MVTRQADVVTCSKDAPITRTVGSAFCYQFYAIEGENQQLSLVRCPPAPHGCHTEAYSIHISLVPYLLLLYMSEREAQHFIVKTGIHLYLKENTETCFPI